MDRSDRERSAATPVVAAVTNGSYNANYSYVANPPVVEQILFKNDSTTRMTTTKQYDYLNRLRSISSTPNGAGEQPLSFAYNYNDANQRIRATLADGSYWIYQYDDLGQVTVGKKYWSDGTPVAGQMEYGFDLIGNRTSAKSGGDNVRSSLRLANYTVNSLNQYTSRDVPGYLDIKGIGMATNAVSVNGQSTYRKREYFRKELSVANGGASVWEAVMVSATNETPVMAIYLHGGDRFMGTYILNRVRF